MTKNILKEKGLPLAILIMSLLSLVPFIVFLWQANEVANLATIADGNDAIINDVLSRTITTPIIMVPFIIGIIIWTTNGIVSAIALVKQKVSKPYGFASLIFGGIGLHLVVMLFSWIFKNRISARVHKKKGIITLSVALLATVGTGGFAFAYTTYDQPYIEDEISYSLNDSSPNLIEIFTDGFDQWNLPEYKVDDSFKDFDWFTKFQTTSIITHRSVPSINSSFAKWNPFSLMHREGFGPDELNSKVYGKYFLDSGIEHMNMDTSHFGQRNLVNPICFSDDASYGATVGSTPKAIKKLDPGLNIANWSGIRDKNVGKIGLQLTSPDNGAYRYMRNEFNTNATKGARVYLADMITHRPFMSNANGSFTTFDVDKDDAKANLKKQLEDLFASLSKKNASGKSVYDNSMIIIYGDHSSHDKYYFENGINQEYKNAQSAMMVKYPKQNNSQVDHEHMEVINDRLIFSSSVNKLIDNYFENPNVNQIEDFIKTDPLFDVNIPRPTFISEDSYIMTHWVNDELTSIGKPVTFEEYYKENSSHTEIEDVKYGSVPVDSKEAK